MFSCYLCNKTLSNAAETIKHLRNVHCYFDSTKLFLKCCYPSCLSTFTTFSGYRKHLKKHEIELNKTVESECEPGISVA